MLFNFFKSCRWVRRGDSLADHFDQCDRYHSIVIDQSFPCDDLERKVTLAVYLALEALGGRTSDDVVHHLRLAQDFFIDVAFVAAPALQVVARWRQMYDHRHHLETTLIVLCLTQGLLVLKEHDGTSDKRDCRYDEDTDECP